MCVSIGESSFLVGYVLSRKSNIRSLVRHQEKYLQSFTSCLGPTHTHTYIHTFGFGTVDHISNGERIYCIVHHLTLCPLLPHLIRFPEAQSINKLTRPRTSPWCLTALYLAYIVFNTFIYGQKYLLIFCLFPCMAEVTIEDIKREEDKSIDIFRVGVGSHGVTGGKGGGRKASPKRNAAMELRPKLFFSTTSLLFTSFIMLSLTSVNMSI